MRTLQTDSTGSNRPAGDDGKVIQFPRLDTVSPFDRLTATLVVAQHRAGVLPEPVLIALLAAVGLPA
jgi:hypothetical protein